MGDLCLIVIVVFSSISLAEFRVLDSNDLFTEHNDGKDVFWGLEVYVFFYGLQCGLWNIYQVCLLLLSSPYLCILCWSR